MQTVPDIEFSAGKAMSNFNRILLIFAIALVFNLARGQKDKVFGEEKSIEDARGSPKVSNRVARHDEETNKDKHKELGQLRVPPQSTLVEDISEIAKHISKGSATHEEMVMDESSGQERIYNVHLHKPSIPPKRQVVPDSGILAELDGHSCAQEAKGFAHSHEAAVISHELLCEVTKLSRYLAYSQAHLQNDIVLNSHSAISQEYAELAAEEALANILENSVVLAADAQQTSPPEVPSSVPITSIQASVIRIRDALTRLTVHFEDVVVKTIGEHPELLEQLRQQLVEVENTLVQLRPDYDNFVNELSATSRAIYQGYLAAGLPPAVADVSAPAAKPATAANGDSIVTTYSTSAGPQGSLGAQATATITNGQSVNPFINARLLRRVLTRVARHVIKNLDVQLPSASSSEGHVPPTYPFINEGFYGSILKHIIKHLYTLPTSPVSPGVEEDTTVDPLINASVFGGILGHPIIHHPYVYHPYIHHSFIPYPLHPHIYTSLVSEQEQPSDPIINENAITNVLKHIIKHFNYVQPGTTESVQPDDLIINEHLLGSIVRHLAHRFHGHFEGGSPAPESPLTSPPSHPIPPVVQPSLPHVSPSFPSPTGPTYSQSSSSSYTGGSASSSSTVTGSSPSPALTPTPYTGSNYPGVSHLLPHVPASSGATFSQSTSSSYTPGSASSSSTLTGTAPAAQSANLNPGQVHPSLPQSGTLYRLPPVPSYSGSTYSQSTSSSYTPQSASSSNTATSAGPSGNLLAPQATKSLSGSSSYTPGSASSSSTVTGTSGTASNPSLYPQAYYRGPLNVLPPLTSNTGTTYSQSTSSSYTPGSASSSQTTTGTGPSPQPYSNQGYPNSELYTSRLRGKPVVVPKPPSHPGYPGTYSSSSSSSNTPSSASSSTTTTAASSFANTHPFFHQTAPIYTAASLNGNHNSVPQVQPYPSQSNTFSTSSSNSYTRGSASSSSTLTGTSSSRVPSPQPASVSGNRNTLSQLQSTPSHPGTFSTGSTSSYTPGSSSASATRTSTLAVHPGSAAATESKSSPSSFTQGSASSSNTLTGSSQKLGGRVPVQYEAPSDASDSHVSASEVVSSSDASVKPPGSSTPPYSPTLLPPPTAQKPVAVASINVDGYETMNVTLIFPQDKVASALGRRTLLPGDIVAIPIKSGTFLLGRVADAVTPISFKLSHSSPAITSLRKEGRIWRLRVKDFQDAHCRSQLNKLLEVINNQA